MTDEQAVMEDVDVAKLQERVERLDNEIARLEAILLRNEWNRAKRTPKQDREACEATEKAVLDRIRFIRFHRQGLPGEVGELIEDVANDLGGDHGPADGEDADPVLYDSPADDEPGEED